MGDRKPDFLNYNMCRLLICVITAVLMLFLCRSKVALAEERSDAGTAYAIVTDDGEMVLFRSMDTYSNNSYATVTDIMGNTYTGYVYDGIETNYWSVYGANAVRPSSQWGMRKESITSVRVADGQVIRPISIVNWFNNFTNMTSCNLEGLDTSRTEAMSFAFGSCNSLTSLDLSHLDVSNVSGFNAAFQYCPGLTSLNLSGWNTESATSMAWMFQGCSSLTFLDVSGFNTGNVTEMGRMFYNCSGLTSLDLSGWNTGNVTNMQSMFEGCSSLTSLDTSGWDTANVRYMDQMFYNCSSIKSLNLSGFSTASNPNMDYMFFYCSSLKRVDLSPDFSFRGSSSALPTPPSESTYTGKWIHEDELAGPYTPEQLVSRYNGASMSGRWIWEGLVPEGYMIRYEAPDNTYGGSMTNQAAEPAEDVTLTANAFIKFGYHFDHWNGNDGNEYEDEAVIPANTFDEGDELVLTAVFEEDENTLAFTEGKAEFYLRGGEKLTLPDIPGGSFYKVVEETPDGWQLVTQYDPSGLIQAGTASSAGFVNKYVPGTATISLFASKTLDERAPAANAFSFELYEDGNLVETASNDASGMVVFQTLTFTQPAVKHYSIKEVCGSDTGISYDTHTESFTVTVEDDGYGNLVASSSLNGRIPAFVNETKPGTLEVKKETTEPGTGDEIFTFAITLTNEYGQALDNIIVVQDD